MTIRTHHAGAPFVGLDLSGADFTTVDLRPFADTSDLPSGDRLIRADFTSTRLHKARFIGVRAPRAGHVL